MLAVGGTADAQDGADAQSAQRLFDQFADPGSEFRTKPFMVWNTEITPHRIDRILSEYQEQGCGGVFIHPRLGLITEYLSPTWNEMVKYTVDKGRDLGLYEDVVLKNGRTVQRKAKGVLKQRIIITFSRKMMEYQRTVRNRQIERAKKLLALKDPEEIKKGPNDVKRFMKRVSKTKSGEKVIVEYTLDESKIAEEEKYDGYYAIATNLADPAKDILAVSQKRYQIEDCFRIIKTNFDGRPVNHRLAERIRAHFLICYTALLVYRLLEAQLDDQKTHVTPANLVTTLKNMTVTNIHDIDFMALYKGSKTLDALTQLTRMPLDRRHYRPKDLNGMIKKFLS